MNPTHQVHEIRPPETAHEVYRLTDDGLWVLDDGEWGLAFIGNDTGPMAWYFGVGYQRNIAWSWCKNNQWRTHGPGCHPNGNPWHYELTNGENEWGGSWGRDEHPNGVAGRKAVNECCNRNSCANGRGPRYEIGDSGIAERRLRVRDTGEVVTFPVSINCMYCGELEIEDARLNQAEPAPTAEADDG